MTGGPRPSSVIALCLLSVVETPQEPEFLISCFSALHGLHAHFLHHIAISFYIFKIKD